MLFLFGSPFTENHLPHGFSMFLDFDMFWRRSGSVQPENCCTSSPPGATPRTQKELPNEVSSGSWGCSAGHMWAPRLFPYTPRHVPIPGHEKSHEITTDGAQEEWYKFTSWTKIPLGARNTCQEFLLKRLEDPGSRC